LYPVSIGIEIPYFNRRRENIFMNQDWLSNPSAGQIISVPDLNDALDFFTARLGFRVDMIFPADTPHTAVISGQGLTLRLESEAEKTTPIEVEPNVQKFIISRINKGDLWSTGRAGMQYRDLIPSRLGGQFIASHIRIPDGGETPDYVHFHKVRFQMIYCKTGWARVVYEDQGPPFILETGDCVLQPPEIRHRVLESSPGLEVIEISSPAIHETWADHELILPTSQHLPERIFNGQKFVRHQAKNASWKPTNIDGLEARDTGIGDATNGLAAVRVLRTTKSISANVDKHRGEFLFWFVLNGELNLNGIDYLQAGHSCVIPVDKGFIMHADPGLELLEVSLKR
jgi:quercetin dioxygenase-like cupin family protein